MDNVVCYLCVCVCWVYIWQVGVVWGRVLCVYLSAGVCV